MAGPAFAPPKWRKPPPLGYGNAIYSVGLWSGGDVRDWWPELQENSELETRLREEQAESFRRWQVWAKWTRTSHGTGVLTLLAGLALALPPPQGGAQGSLRWAALGGALIQPYRGKASRQSLEIYSRLALSDAQQAHEQTIGRYHV